MTYKNIQNATETYDKTIPVSPTIAIMWHYEYQKKDIRLFLMTRTCVTFDMFLIKVSS